MLHSTVKKRSSLLSQYLTLSHKSFISHLLINISYHFTEPGSTVSIVSGYGLDDRVIEVRSPAETKGFFLYPLCPDRLWGPPSLLYNGYRGSFPRGKARPGRDADHSPQSSAEVKNE
jgi:hypothetical protein